MKRDRQVITREDLECKREMLTQVFRIQCDLIENMKNRCCSAKNAGEARFFSMVVEGMEKDRDETEKRLRGLNELLYDFPILIAGIEVREYENGRAE